MQATIPSGIGPFNGRNYGAEKETIGAVRVIAYHNGEFTTPVDFRFYAGRSASASRVYCTAWLQSTAAPSPYIDEREIRHRLRWKERSGTGYAGGGGYHKPSAALSAALDSAGVTLDSDIDGRGDSAIREAAEACARALGYDTFTITAWGVTQ